MRPMPVLRQSSRRVPLRNIVNARIVTTTIGKHEVRSMLRSESGRKKYTAADRT